MRRLAPPVPWRAVARRAGLDVQRLAPQVWLVQRPGERRRVAQRVGPEDLRTHLVTDPQVLRNRPHQVQRRLAQATSAEHVRWLLRLLGVNCVLDVGANVGQYAEQLRRVGYRGRIVSFEPLPQLAEVLREKAAADPDWRVYECAVGEETTEAEIQMRPGTMSSLLPASEFGREWHARLRDARPQRVQVRRLDELFDELVAGIDDPRPYLKLDTQGYDLAAFRGAGERVRQFVGMQSEVSCVPIYEGMSTMFEQVAAYQGAGFAVSNMFPVSFHAPTARAVEFDVMLVRPDRVAGS